MNDGAMPAAAAHPAHRSHGRALGETAYILGFAGLLPQVVALGVTGFGHGSDLGPLFAFGYASLILSFIGGAWWGFAMGDTAYQSDTALAAVIPSIIAAALVLASIGAMLPLRWALVLIGASLMLTLLFDRVMAARGQTPSGWMGLRIALSIGLGSLTILTGIIA